MAPSGVTRAPCCSSGMLIPHGELAPAVSTAAGSCAPRVRAQLMIPFSISAESPFVHGWFVGWRGDACFAASSRQTGFRLF